MTEVQIVKRWAEKQADGTIVLLIRLSEQITLMDGSQTATVCEGIVQQNNAFVLVPVGDLVSKAARVMP